MNKDDFKDPEKRDEYFQPKEGRPSDHAIFAAVDEMVAFVGPHAIPDDPFISNDICLTVRNAFPGQGVYIGTRTSYLERTGQLPIRRLGTWNKRVFYSIVN